jgi:hypothetical protein
MPTFIKRHFRNLEELLKSQSALCQTEVPKYDIGLNREFFVREILRTHLPPYCGITSGSVCDQEHKPTGQVDIILFHPLSLKINIGTTDCCLSESIFSVIEIKSRLYEDHFESSIRNLSEIWSLSRSNLYTPLLGATTSSEAYYCKTVGTILFGYKGYSPLKCIEVIRSLLIESWDRRPEVIYLLGDSSYILVRDDYLQYEGPGVLQGTGSTWIEKLKPEKKEGYLLIQKDCLLVLMTILSKRIQCNYHLLPSLYNYVLPE